MAAKKKTVAVADTAINEKLVAEISDPELSESERRRKLNAKLRQYHGAGTYTNLRADETPEHTVCGLLVENIKINTEPMRTSYKH